MKLDSNKSMAEMLGNVVAMQCYIYRSRRKLGAYLYLAEKDNFSALPEVLLKLFGQPEFSFEFKLKENSKLVRAETVEVLKQLQAKGFYLQMPSQEDAKTWDEHLKF